MKNLINAEELKSDMVTTAAHQYWWRPCCPNLHQAHSNTPGPQTPIEGVIMGSAIANTQPPGQQHSKHFLIKKKTHLISS